MTCGGCVSKVTQALTAVPDVGHVDVSLPNRLPSTSTKRLTSRERLQSAVKDAGYGVAAGGDAVIELSALVAFQNLSSKFNSTLGVPAKGFCASPEPWEGS